MKTETFKSIYKQAVSSEIIKNKIAATDLFYKYLIKRSFANSDKEIFIVIDKDSLDQTISSKHLALSYRKRSKKRSSFLNGLTFNTSEFKFSIENISANKNIAYSLRSFNKNQFDAIEKQFYILQSKIKAKRKMLFKIRKFNRGGAILYSQYGLKGFCPRSYLSRLFKKTFKFINKFNNFKLSRLYFEYWLLGTTAFSIFKKRFIFGAEKRKFRVGVKSIRILRRRANLIFKNYRSRSKYAR